MSDTNIELLLARIAEQQHELLAELQSQRKTRKDFWDRLTAISPIMAAAIMACIGAYFTYSYNQQQLKMQEIQTVERFIPHLIGDEKTKRAAILAISSMGNAPLAAKVASIFASEGTASALRSIASNGEEKDQKIVREALYKTLEVLTEKYKFEGKDQRLLDNLKPATYITDSNQVEGPAAVPEATATALEKPKSERSAVEAVHLKQPEPRAEANSSVEADEAENQHARASVAESTHSKQQ